MGEVECRRAEARRLLRSQTAQLTFSVAEERARWIELLKRLVLEANLLVLSPSLPPTCLPNRSYALRNCHAGAAFSIYDPSAI